MRQLKIDVLSVLVVTDKLEFAGPAVSGNLSPQGGRIIAQRGAATRRNAGFGIKNNRNPDQRGGVAGKRS